MQIMNVKRASARSRRGNVKFLFFLTYTTYRNYVELFIHIIYTHINTYREYLFLFVNVRN